MSENKFEPPPPYTSGPPNPPPPNPPPGFVPPQPPVAVVVTINLGPNPARLTCPNCHRDIITATNTTAGLLTWVLCGTLAFVGLFWGPCLLPFCIDSCKDVEHSCPNCGTVLGIYKRIGN
ncbi:hypothetical protein B4U79_12956 [Dinothrombium tinctorium]|uniref:LITAF domain-containing protein n=1 Tax=Dinothrombium tinctorium TaxID=1965070 RepID=A0A443QF09_9ACAR|nr:hypothetical protein B4U79_02537 [Dinothrombium tinctorium]RWS01601.1 hypothetical protein B4U79_12956 [Dinothrombium tinctorium]